MVSSSVDGVRRKSQLAEEAWFLMHHSDDPRRMSVAVHCDDSGSHEGSKFVVVGSTIMNKQGFIDLDHAWKKIIHEFRLESIHMHDFVRPFGCHSAMRREMKLALFASLAKAINRNKLYSVSIAVPQVEEVYRKLFGPPYALAFLAIAIANRHIAIQRGYNNRIAYLVDKGSRHHHEQLEGAHGVLLQMEKDRREQFTGSMTSDLDDNNNALQAADVIAWTYHRQLESEEFGEEFTPLLSILLPKQEPEKKRAHLSLCIPRDGIAIFARFINGWIENKGAIPSWEELQNPDLIHIPFKAP